MSLIEASAATIHVVGRDGKEYRLSPLTMRQIGELSSWWMDGLRGRFMEDLSRLGLTKIEQAAAMREFELNEPSYGYVVRFGLSPAGVDRVCRLAMCGGEVEALGETMERAELASRLLGLAPEGQSGETGDEGVGPFAAERAPSGR